MLLLPPELRKKNRFHQMFILHKWGEFILEQWSKIGSCAKTELDFVQANKPLIITMRQCYDLIQLFSSLFKTKGIQRQSLQMWDEQVAQYRTKWTKLDDKAECFIEKMNSYLTKQQAAVADQTQVLCCSDIIESTFGKYKNKRVRMITDDVLKIAGYSSCASLQEIQAAMLQVRVEHTLEWKARNTTLSKLAILRRKQKSAA